MFKDAQQGVWDGVQEQILIRMLRKWGRRYKSDDEENLPVICRTIQLLYFTFCHIISTQSAPLYTCSPHPCWLSQLTFIVISFASSAGSISRVVWQAWQVWLAGHIDCFSITTFICYKLHWLLFYHHFYLLQRSFFQQVWQDDTACSLFGISNCCGKVDSNFT